MALLRRGKCVRSLPENKKRVVDEKLFNVKCSHGFFLSNVASNWSASVTVYQKKMPSDCPLTHLTAKCTTFRPTALRRERTVHLKLGQKRIWGTTATAFRSVVQASALGVDAQAKIMSQDWVGSDEKAVVGGKLIEMYKYVVWKLSRRHICRRCSFIRQRTSNTTQIPNFQEITQRT